MQPWTIKLNMTLTHKAKRCKLAYTTTHQFLSQTPLPHEPNTDYIYTLTLNISIHLCSKDLQPFLCRRLNGTQRNDGASKTSPTCYTPRLHCHTQTHQRSQAVHSSKAEWNCSVPVYQQGRLSLEDTNSILSPHYHLNAWEPAPLHTTERAQRQLLAHQSLELDFDAVKKKPALTLFI